MYQIVLVIVIVIVRRAFSISSSSVVDAAQTAARVGARRLMLTHLVPAPMPEQYPEWKAIAAEYFDGEIVIGDDLTAVTLTAESE